MNEKEASLLVREIIAESHRAVRTFTHEDERAALAYLDVLERNYIDTKAQREEDEHPALVKLISLDGTSNSTRITFGGSNVRNVTKAWLDLDAARRSHPGILRTESIDEARLKAKGGAAWPGGLPIVQNEIPLASIVFRGVRL